jgi:hypothetical protein
MHGKTESFDEAVALLRGAPKGAGRRFSALRKGFEGREVIEHGVGLFAVEVATGRVCEFTGLWSSDGQFLVCENCFEDGT